MFKYYNENNIWIKKATNNFIFMSDIELIFFFNIDKQLEKL